MVKLDKDQLRALESVTQGYNTFITGSAGTGKSFLVERIYEWVIQTPKRYAISAMTGTAATLLPGGRTFHSAMKLGPMNPDPQNKENLINKISKSPKLRNHWKTLSLIIIDEISMMPAWMFTLFDETARWFRNPVAPFGGIQVILLGDFFQLPPVTTAKDEQYYAFQTDAWKRGVHRSIVLPKIYRQMSDLEFAECLNRIRIGQATDADIRMLEECLNKEVPQWLGDIKPTHLYSTNAAVDQINQRELEALPGPIYAFKTKLKIKQKKEEDLKSDANSFDSLNIKDIEKAFSVDEKLRLAVGAQVVLKVNLDVPNGLANGSRGVVTSIEKYPMVRFINGIECQIEPHTWKFNDKQSPVVIYKKQIPLKLAYALTIHSCQGSSLDCAEVDLGDSIFENGQVYTALSRVRNTKGLFIKSFNPLKIKTDPRVVAFYESLEPSCSLSDLRAACDKALGKAPKAPKAPKETKATKATKEDSDE